MGLKARPAFVQVRPYAARDSTRVLPRAELVRLARAHEGNVSALALELGVARVQIRRWALALDIDLAAMRARSAAAGTREPPEILAPKVVAALRASRGNVSATAAQFGVARVQVRRWAAAAGLDLGRLRSARARRSALTVRGQRGSTRPRSTPRPVPSIQSRRARALRLLETNGGNISVTARKLGIARVQVRRWARAAGVDLVRLRDA